MALSTYDPSTKQFFEDAGDTLRLTVDDMNRGQADQIPAVGTLLAASGQAGIAKAISIGTEFSLTFDQLTLNAVPVNRINPTGGNNGDAIVISNGVAAWATLPAGSIYTGTAPIAVAGGAISVLVGTVNGSVAAGNDARIVGAEQVSRKGATNGYAGLDGTGKVPSAQLPAIPVTLSSVLSATGTGATAASNLGFASVAATGVYGDLSGKPTLGGAAARDVGTTAGTVAAGDDSRFSSGLGQSAPRIITSSANTTLLTGDTSVYFNRTTSPAATTVTLPASPVSGKRLTIKDMSGNAAAFPITVQASSGTIDGAANFVIDAVYDGFTFEFNSIEWSVF